MGAPAFGRPTRATQPMRLDPSLNPHHGSPVQQVHTTSRERGRRIPQSPHLVRRGWSFDHLYSGRLGRSTTCLGGSPVRPTLLDGPLDRMTHRMFDADGEWIVRIHSQVQHFARLQRRMAVQIDSLGVPTRQMLAEMLEVAFWASLTSNEGRPTRVRIVMLRAGFPDDVLAFKHSMPYTEDEIAQLAPATSATAWLAVDMMEKTGSHLGHQQEADIRQARRRQRRSHRSWNYPRRLRAVPVICGFRWQVHDLSSRRPRYGSDGSSPERPWQGPEREGRCRKQHSVARVPGIRIPGSDVARGQTRWHPARRTHQRA